MRVDESTTKNTWETIQQTTVTDSRVARQHLWLNVDTYLGLFVIELSCAQLAHSQVLRADAFNNLSGIFSTSLLMTSLYMAAKTHDNDLWGAPIAPSEQLAMSPRIQQSRFRFETLYILVAGLVMVEIAGDIIYQATRTLFSPTTSVLQSRIAGIGAGLSTLILLLLWLTNRHWAHRLADTALVAAAEIFQLTQQVDTLMKQTFNVAATALMVIPSDQLP